MSEYFDREYFEDGTRSEYDKYSFVITNPVFYEQAEMLNKIFDVSLKKILDLGCAKGNLVFWLKYFDADAYGQDISQWAYENSHVQQYHRCGDIGKSLLFEDNTFDYLVSFGTLEHIDNFQNVITESVRVLKSGGLLIVDIGLNGHEHDPSFIKRSKDEYTTILYKFLINRPEFESRLNEYFLVKTYNWSMFVYQKP